MACEQARLSVVAKATKGGKPAKGDKPAKGAKTASSSARKTVRDRAGWWGDNQKLGQFYGPERGLYLGMSYDV